VNPLHFAQRHLKPLPYPVLLLIACVGLIFLMFQDIPVTYKGRWARWDFHSLFWQLYLTAILLGIVSVRVARHLYIIPTAYVTLTIAALTLNHYHVASRMLDCGMLGFLFFIAAYLSTRADLGYVLAALYVRSLCYWYSFLLAMSVPNHADAFVRAATASTGVAGLMAVGAGCSVLFNWWPVRFSNFVGALLLNLALFSYFYYDLAYWISLFLDQI
jgi:hypothetical protein